MGEVHCSACSFVPPCATLEQMRERHGTPAEFEMACWRATADFITPDEARASIDRYKMDWLAAGGA